MLAWFKFQAKIRSRSRVCVQGEWQKYTPPCPPLSNDEGLRDIGHSMSIRNLILGVNSVTVSYLIHYNSLVQNAIAILLQKARDVFYEIGQAFYYKIRELLQNANFTMNCDSTSKYCLFQLIQQWLSKCFVWKVFIWYTSYDLRNQFFETPINSK